MKNSASTLAPCRRPKPLLPELQSEISNAESPSPKLAIFCCKPDRCVRVHRNSVIQPQRLHLTAELTRVPIRFVRQHDPSGNAMSHGTFKHSKSQFWLRLEGCLGRYTSLQ